MTARVISPGLESLPLSKALRAPSTEAKRRITRKTTPPAIEASTIGKNLPPKKVTIVPNAIRRNPRAHGFSDKNLTIEVA